MRKHRDTAHGGYSATNSPVAYLSPHLILKSIQGPELLLQFPICGLLLYFQGNQEKWGITKELLLR